MSSVANGIQLRNRVLAVACIAIVAGLSLQTYQIVFLSHGPVDAFLLKLLLRSCAPYLVCAFVLFALHRPWPAAVAGWLVLVADAYMHYSVFISPESSTAALGLVFLPPVNLVAILPAGLLVGWFIGWHISRR